MHVTSLGAARGDARGELLLIPFLPWCGMEFHDLFGRKTDLRAQTALA